MNSSCQKVIAKRLSNVGGVGRGFAVSQNRAVLAALDLVSPICGRIGSIRVAVVIGVVLGATPALWAEHARIDLRVSGQGKEVTAAADEEPPAGGNNEPPVIIVNVKKPLVLQFIFTNTFPHKVIEHVTVRYYVLRVKTNGRKPSPSFPEPTGPDKLSQSLVEQGVVTMGQFTMDFKPDCRVGTRVNFQISEPGLYTARVETLNTQSDHEHFSAIDLVAK